MQMKASTPLQVIVYGGGGHAKVVLDTLLQSGVAVREVVDPRMDGELFGVKKVKSISLPLGAGTSAIIAIGDNRTRKQISNEVASDFFSAIHPSATISGFSSVGEGSMILHRAIIQAGTTLGKHVIMNTASQVDHDCMISDYVHIAPGAILCGNVIVGEGTLIGAGAVVKPGIRIGAWATVGSGAVVVKDVSDNAVVVGNPARILKYMG